MKVLIVIAVVALAIGGCKDACGGVGLERFSPMDTTVAVGASFVIRYEEGGTCTPGHVTDADYHTVMLTWQTADTATVRVDSSRVTARAVGDAIIGAVERPAQVYVHVR